MIEQSFFLAPIEQAQQCFAACSAVLPEALARATNALSGALCMRRKVLTCGNGGSAGDAQHLASELVNRFETERMALAAISLVPDSSVVTAIANDYSYEVLFSRQVDALGCEGDVLIAFSTSGNSRNIVLAIDAAHRRGMKVIAMTGKDGGDVARLLDRFDVEVRAPANDTARIQEIHLLAIHSICKALDAHFTGDKIQRPKLQADWQHLAELTNALRPLVFTSGVFDVLHRGHVTYLQTARRMGAYLVVGVNSDASVRRLGKGQERPIQPDEDRMHILAGLECVDFVTIFDEDTPVQLIEVLVPDVLVKGGDYPPQHMVGADFVKAHGGRVEVINFEHQRTTSQIVQKCGGPMGPVHHS